MLVKNNWSATAPLHKSANRPLYNHDNYIVLSVVKKSPFLAGISSPRFDGKLIMGRSYLHIGINF